MLSIRRGKLARGRCETSDEAGDSVAMQPLQAKQMARGRMKLMSWGWCWDWDEGWTWAKGRPLHTVNNTGVYETVGKGRAFGISTACFCFFFPCFQVHDPSLTSLTSVAARL